MRVITGSARGRRLDAPPGQNTRPTAARVKEAALSIIQFELEGAAVLDLFAGSGQMGIEALSRGAASCIFVDSSKSAQEVIRKNLSHTGLAANARIAGSDVLSWLSSAKGPVDIAFVDPPYQAGLLGLVLEKLAPLMREGSGAVLCEASNREEFPKQAGALALRREYRYGKTKLALYRFA